MKVILYSVECKESWGLDPFFYIQLWSFLPIMPSCMIFLNCGCDLKVWLWEIKQVLGLWAVVLSQNF